MKNRFELCPIKKEIRNEVVDYLLAEINKPLQNTFTDYDKRYAFLPGVNGFTEKLLSKRIDKCKKSHDVYFDFYELNSDIRNEWNTTFLKFEDVLEHKGYEVTHNRIIDKDILENSNELNNGGWLDLCAPRTHKVVKFVTDVMQWLNYDGLMFFTWGETYKRIPQNMRSDITPKQLVEQLNTIDCDPTCRYELVELNYTNKNGERGTYINSYSYGAKMITFGIRKVCIIDKPQNITSEPFKNFLNELESFNPLEIEKITGIPSQKIIDFRKENDNNTTNMKTNTTQTVKSTDTKMYTDLLKFINTYADNTAKEIEHITGIPVAKVAGLRRAITVRTNK